MLPRRFLHVKRHDCNLANLSPALILRPLHLTSPPPDCRFDASRFPPVCHLRQPLPPHSTSLDQTARPTLKVLLEHVLLSRRTNFAQIWRRNGLVRPELRVTHDRHMALTIPSQAGRYSGLQVHAAQGIAQGHPRC